MSNPCTVCLKLNFKKLKKKKNKSRELELGPTLKLSLKQKETHSYKEKETGPQRSSKHLTTFKNKIQCPSKKKKKGVIQTPCVLLSISRNI